MALMSIKDRPNDVIKTEVGTFWLPIGRLSYESLLKAKLAFNETDPSKAKFGTSYIMPRPSQLAPLRLAIKQAAYNKWGDRAKTPGFFKDPILNHAEKVDNPELTAEFPWLLRLTSKFKSKVIFPSGDACDSPDEIYSGRWVRMSVNVFAWQQPTGKGVSCGLGTTVLLTMNGDKGGRLAGTGPAPEKEFKGLFKFEEPEDPFNEFGQMPDQRPGSGANSLFD